MKKLLTTMIVLSALGSTMAHARFVDAGVSGGNQTVSFAWTWSAMKEAVVTKVSYWFNRSVSNDNRSPASEASSVAGTSPQTNASGKSDSWNPFVSTEVPKVASGPTITPEVNMKNAAVKIRDIRVSRVAQPAIAFKDKHLTMGRNNIPVFEFKKFQTQNQLTHLKKVPLLNIGSEAILESSPFELISVIPFPAVPYEAPKVLAAPSLATASQFKEISGAPVIAAAPAENIIVPILEPEKKVTSEKIAKILYETKADESVTPLAVTKIAEEDLKLLRGLILFEKKDQCHVAAGIFGDLLDNKREDISSSARYHLGVCLHEMNLPTEALHHLSKVMTGTNSLFASDAIKISLEDLQLQHEDSLVANLLTVDPKLIPEKSMGQVEYLKAKYYLKKGAAEKGLEAAVRVPQGNPFFFKAQYLAAVAEYELDRVDSSIERQKLASVELAKKGDDPELLALMEVNLGRTAFQKGRYKEALEAFQKVPKESSLWMEALMELGWVQLQSKDVAGAIGNMHSIQSPYFDGVFKPESYVVRTIGYLNICQYGDAFRSLGYLEHKYGQWLEKVDQYNNTHDASQTYLTVLKMLSAKTTQDIDGVPPQALREVAHQRNYLNTQEALNQLIDENSGYAFVKSLIEKDKRALIARRNATVNKVAELNNKIKKARTTPDAMKNFNAWRFELANYEDFLAVYEFKVKTIKEGQEGLSRITPKAQERLAAHKTALKEKAGKVLKEHMVKLVKNLHQQLENNELLKYEVFAGSGENLRYQMAGGKTGGNSKNSVDRKPAGMKWEFEGEYWEDEIGHYRSSLKNNCQTQVAGRKNKE